MSALDTQVGGGHYREGGIQPVQYIEANNLGFLEGCVVKRLTRHNRASGKGRQDIEKAIHELQLLLELRYPLAQEPLEFDEDRADIIGQNGNDGEHYPAIHDPFNPTQGGILSNLLKRAYSNG